MVSDQWGAVPATHHVAVSCVTDRWRPGSTHGTAATRWDGSFTRSRRSGSTTARVGRRSMRKVHVAAWATASTLAR